MGNGLRNSTKAVGHATTRVIDELLKEPSQPRTKEPQPDPKEPAPWRCAPCNKGRFDSCPLAGVVLLIVLANYASAVLYPLGVDRVRYPGEPTMLAEHTRPWSISLWVLVYFHVPLLLAIVSWASTCCTDPGTAKWSGGRGTWPPRSRRWPSTADQGCTSARSYDSVTGRLTLNMDHFCPWVVNTVGFYNKFSCSSCSTPTWRSSTRWPSSGTSSTRRTPRRTRSSRRGPSSSSTCGSCAASTSSSSRSSCPSAWHVLMVMRNQTTIDGKRFPQYDMGVGANVRQVLGRTHGRGCSRAVGGPEGDGEMAHATGGLAAIAHAGLGKESRRVESSACSERLGYDHRREALMATLGTPRRTSLVAGLRERSADLQRRGVLRDRARTRHLEVEARASLAVPVAVACGAWGDEVGLILCVVQREVVGFVACRASLGVGPGRGTG